MTLKKSSKKNEKNFDAVRFMREARTTISKETEGMNYEQLQKYFAEHKRAALKK